MIYIADKIPVKPDCFIVLSYAVKNRNTPTLPTRKLIETALKWHYKFPKAYIIMSTGDNQFLGVTNARVMAQYGIKIGIPKNKIIEEGQSKNTVENLQYSRNIMDSMGLDHPTLITLDLHTKRAVAIAGKLGWKDLSWISVYSRGDAAYGYKALQTCSRFLIYVYENLAYIYAKLRNEI
jgi:uncharacterized SAM-binding protein YcdF (DUF218 family)